MIARLTYVVLHCHHNRTLIACNCLSAINQMFTVTSHTLMMQAQAAPKFYPSLSQDAESAGVDPGAGLKHCTDTGLRSCHIHFNWEEANTWVNVLLILYDAAVEDACETFRWYSVLCSQANLHFIVISCPHTGVFLSLDCFALYGWVHLTNFNHQPFIPISVTTSYNVSNLF